MATCREHEWWSIISIYLHHPHPHVQYSEYKSNLFCQLSISLGINTAAYTVHTHTYIFSGLKFLNWVHEIKWKKTPQCIIRFQRGADALDPIREEVMPWRYKWNPATSRLSLFGTNTVSQTIAHSLASGPKIHLHPYVWIAIPTLYLTLHSKGWRVIFKIGFKGFQMG